MTTLVQQTLTEKKQLTQLVRAAQAGDRQAFDQLFQRYQRAVYAAALRRLDDHAEAQELVQEVFIQAMRKIGQLENPLCFGGWLRSITTSFAWWNSIKLRSASAISHIIDRLHSSKEV